MTSKILCGLSLGLCLAALGFYIDSYSTCQEAFYSPGNHTVWAYSLRGEVTVSYDHTSGESGFWRLPGASSLLMMDDVEYEHRQATFRFPWGRRTQSQVVVGKVSTLGLWGFRLGAPHWFIAILFSIAPALWLVQYFRRGDRRRPGYCKACGYDLSGTVLAGRPSCPECGHDVPESAPAVA